MHGCRSLTMAILKDMAPWPDPNYAIDESWAAVRSVRKRSPRRAERDATVADSEPRAPARNLPGEVERTRRLEDGGGESGNSDPRFPGGHGGGGFHG